MTALGGTEAQCVEQTDVEVGAPGFEPGTFWSQLVPNPVDWLAMATRLGIGP